MVNKKYYCHCCWWVVCNVHTACEATCTHSYKTVYVLLTNNTWRHKDWLSLRRHMANQKDAEYWIAVKSVYSVVRQILIIWIIARISASETDHCRRLPSFLIKSNDFKDGLRYLVMKFALTKIIINFHASIFSKNTHLPYFINIWNQSFVFLLFVHTSSVKMMFLSNKTFYLPPF